MKLYEIDENLAVNMDVPHDVEFFDCFDDPFVINGLYLKEGKKFTRLPSYFKDLNVNDGVKELLSNTSGGRIKFATDSPYVAIIVELPESVNMPHMPSTGHSGVDMYIAKRGKSNYQYYKTFMPPWGSSDIVYSGYFELNSVSDFEEHEVLLNLPLYNGVNSIKIGIKEGCHLYAPVDYDIGPIYYYGNSLTQGGCASRPGNTYMGFISRWLNADFVNLGFSGSALGEREIAEYIATKKMTAFVMDYDANAPTSEHLEATHYNFYKIVREKNPDLPIIIISYHSSRKRGAFQYYGTDKPSRDLIERNFIVMRTYLRAVEEGDKNVYFLDGATVFGTEDQHECTVDNSHPNDLGFYRIAKELCPIFRKIFDK